MRTTITLDDELLQRLEQRASETGSTVSRLIEESVRRSMRRESPAGESEGPFRLITYGRGGRFSAFNLNKAAALLEAEDLDRYGTQPR
jgi:hypothetical protein